LAVKYRLSFGEGGGVGGEAIGVGGFAEGDFSILDEILSPKTTSRIIANSSAGVITEALRP
jgi:hypothetical protein